MYVKGIREYVNTLAGKEIPIGHLFFPLTRSKPDNNHIDPRPE